MDDVTVEPAGRALAGVPGERLAELVAATCDAMSGVIERYGVSEDEWYAALAFLGEVAAADAPGHEPLTTMVFFAGDEWLGNDTIGADRPELTVPIERTGSGPATATFDVTLRSSGRY
jgi:Catechol dioxygenase N terminus